MINWSAIDPHSAAGRLVRLPGRLLPKSAVMRIRRGPARGMRWIAGSATHGCWLGTYEIAKRVLVERLVRPGMTVYDVGAQAGFYTLTFSRLVGEAGRVIAFEPCFRALPYLLEHIRLNKLTNVQVVQAAVGGTPGLGGFSDGLGRCQNRLIDNGADLLVPVLSLDTAGLPPPDLIKMDIEGGESQALKGARNFLSAHRPIILIALHGPEHRMFCPSFMTSLGYRVFDLSGGPIDEAAADEIYALP